MVPSDSCQTFRVITVPCSLAGQSHIRETVGHRREDPGLAEKAYVWVCFYFGMLI